MAIVSTVSTTPTTWAEAIFSLKETLKTAGWIVTDSGCGFALLPGPTEIPYSYGSGTDIISSAAAGDFGLNNEQAWFVIQSPDGYVEYMFQRGNDSSYGPGQGWRVSWSASTTSGGYTGGSPDYKTTPTATDEDYIRGGGTPTSPTYFYLFGVTPGNTRWHIIADNAAPYTWWCGGWAVGTGVHQMGMIHDYLVATTTGDISRYVSYCSYADFTSNSHFQGTSSNPNGTYALRCRNILNTNYTTPVCFIFNQISSFTSLYENSLANPLTGKDEMYPVIYARAADQGDGQWKGISTVMRWMSINRPVTSTYTVNTTRDRVIWQSVSLPWDGSVPAV